MTKKRYDILNGAEIDNDVIDLSGLTREQLDEHFRHLDQQADCPCNNCTGCRESGIAYYPSECEQYQEWLDRMELRYPKSMQGRHFAYRNRYYLKWKK